MCGASRVLGMLTGLTSTLHPARYHGQRARSPFFEGWYYKLVDPTGTTRLALIPGIFKSQAPHAFVQVLDGRSGSVAYHEFPTESFSAAADRFVVEVGGNRFDEHHLEVDLSGEGPTVRGRLDLRGNIPWPVTWSAPGAMGWYAWVPTMECYHGILSLDHSLEGHLEIDGERVDFTGGRGYLEKDWGQSFPSAWVWMQTNHFDTPATCLTGSIAVIPWKRASFRGFIVGLLADGQLHRFTTYTGAQTKLLRVDDEKVEWVLERRGERLEIVAFRGETGTGVLRGPTRVEMGKRVPETLDAEIEVRLSDRSGHTRFEGRGRHAGLETVATEQLVDG